MNPTLLAILISLAVGALGTGGAAWKLHDMRVEQLEGQWETAKTTAVAAAKQGVQDICDANNKVTKEGARALQTKYNTVARNYDRLLHTAKIGNSKPATSSSTAGRDGSTGTDLPPVCIPRGAAADAGRAADNQAAALITLQDIVSSIYKANGQEDLLPDEYRR